MAVQSTKPFGVTTQPRNCKVAGDAWSLYVSTIGRTTSLQDSHEPNQASTIDIARGWPVVDFPVESEIAKYGCPYWQSI